MCQRRIFTYSSFYCIVFGGLDSRLFDDEFPLELASVQVDSADWMHLGDDGKRSTNALDLLKVGNGRDVCRVPVFLVFCFCLGA